MVMGMFHVSASISTPPPPKQTLVLLSDEGIGPAASSTASQGELSSAAGSGHKDLEQPHRVVLTQGLGVSKADLSLQAVGQFGKGRTEQPKPQGPPLILPRSPALLSLGSSKTPRPLPRAQEQGRGQPGSARGWLVGAEPPGLVLLKVGRVCRWSTGEGGRDTNRSR